MTKLALWSLLAALGVMSAMTASAAKPCARKKFETELVKAACAKGGQDEAKKVMKTFLKEAKKKNATLGCATCHSKVGGDYPLKPDGRKLFKDSGGK